MAKPQPDMKKTPTLRRGVAMILVVVLMATAAIMAFALISSASIQAQASRNSIASYSADALAQSGSSLATYYLMNPDKASASLMTTSGSKTFYNPGANFGSISTSNGASVSNIALSVESQSGLITTYGVDVTSNSGTSSAASVTRTLHSDVAVDSRYVVKYAMASNDAFTIPLSGVSVTIGGNVRCDSGIGGLLTAITGSTIIPSNTAKPAYPTAGVPSYSQLNICKSLPQYPTMVAQSAGTGTAAFTVGTGTAQLVSGSITSFPAANASNPDAVYYATGSLTISGAGTYNGTLVVKSPNNLIISANGVTINSKKTGQPALIVGGNLVFNGGVILSTRALTVNGLTWLGGNMLAQGGVLPTTQLTVNGALMWGGTSPKIDTSTILGASYVHVTYPSSGQTLDAPYYDSLYVPDLCNENQTPKDLRVISTSIH
jgi:hypothetical protein